VNSSKEVPVRDCRLSYEATWIRTRLRMEVEWMRLDLAHPNKALVSELEY